MILKRSMFMMIHQKWKNGQYVINVENYVQYNRNPVDYFKLNVIAVEPKIIREYMKGEKKT